MAKSLLGRNVTDVSQFELQGEGTYTGQIHADTLVPHGTGRMDYFLPPGDDGQRQDEDVQSYEGQWHWGSWHGANSILQFRNGDCYIGPFCENARHGQGLYIWEDGRCYEGEFQQNQRQGQGIFTFVDGAVYQGEFYKGRRHGHGRYNFPNGNVYEGEWREGHYDGYGVFTWADGRVYQGEWKESKQHGHGIELGPYGHVVYEGIWVDHSPLTGSVSRVDTATSLHTPSFPQEISISNCTSYDDCSTLAASVSEEPQQSHRLLLRSRSGLSPSTDAEQLCLPRYAVDRSRPVVLDSNFDQRCQTLRDRNTLSGPTRRQHVFRFAPQTVSIPPPQQQTARRQDLSASSKRPAPIKTESKRLSMGEQPASSPFEGLPQINALIRDQREALEKCNASHRRRNQETYPVSRPAYVGGNVMREYR